MSLGLLKTAVEECEDFWNQYFIQKISTGIFEAQKEQFCNTCHTTIWYGAHVNGTKNNTINLIVRQYVYLTVMFWYFFTHDEFDRNTQPQHNTTNIATMVVELLAPPAS